MINLPINKTNYHQYLIWVVALIIVLFPCTAQLVPHGASTPYIVLAILGIFSLFLPKSRSLHFYEKLLIFALVFYSFIALLSFIAGGINELGFKHLEENLKILMAVPIIFLFTRIQIKQDWIWWGIIAASIILGIYSLIFPAVFPEASRVEGIKGPMSFGYIALTLGMFSLAGISYFMHKSKWLFSLPFLACLFGLTASMMSGTRGAWIALPLMIAFAIFFHWKFFFGRKAALSIVILVVPLVMISFSGTLEVQKRFHQAGEHFIRYFNDKDDDENPVGKRFESWITAWKLFKDNPLLGVGIGNYSKEAEKLVKKDAVEDIIAYTTPESSYFYALANSGIAGLISFLLLFLLPGYYFLNESGHPRLDQKSMVMAGILLLLGYLQFALTKSILFRSVPTIFFAFYLTLFTSYISAIAQTEKVE